MPATAKQLRRITNSYTDFLGSLRVVRIALTESKFRVDRKRFFDLEDEKIIIEFSSKPLKKGKDFLDVAARLRVKSQKASAPPSMVLEAVYELHLHTNMRIESEFVERFAASDVRLLVWPYFREYVSNTCDRMFIPPIFLPLAGSLPD